MLPVTVVRDTELLVPGLTVVLGTSGCGKSIVGKTLVLRSGRPTIVVDGGREYEKVAPRLGWRVVGPNDAEATHQVGYPLVIDVGPDGPPVTGETYRAACRLALEGVRRATGAAIVVVEEPGARLTDPEARRYLLHLVDGTRIRLGTVVLIGQWLPDDWVTREVLSRASRVFLMNQSEAGLEHAFRLMPWLPALTKEDTTFILQPCRPKWGLYFDGKGWDRVWFPVTDDELDVLVP